MHALEHPLWEREATPITMGYSTFNMVTRGVEPDNRRIEPCGMWLYE